MPPEAPACGCQRVSEIPGKTVVVTFLPARTPPVSPPWAHEPTAVFSYRPPLTNSCSSRGSESKRSISTPQFLPDALGHGQGVLDTQVPHNGLGHQRRV